MKIILASNSPRRRELLKGLNIPFEVKVIKGIDETYPQELPVQQVAEYIAVKKAGNYQPAEDEIILTADTTVVLGNKILGKPADKPEAFHMLQELSGRKHQVITGVCLTSTEKQIHFSVVSEVEFKTLLISEINYYIDHYKPFDKAGAYGIQEWIGFIGVESLHGSYYNVMGLPVQRIYQALVQEFRQYNLHNTMMHNTMMHNS